MLHNQKYTQDSTAVMTTSVPLVPLNSRSGSATRFTTATSSHTFVLPIATGSLVHQYGYDRLHHPTTDRTPVGLFTQYVRTVRTQAHVAAGEDGVCTALAETDDAVGTLLTGWAGLGCGWCGGGGWLWLFTEAVEVEQLVRLVVL